MTGPTSRGYKESLNLGVRMKVPDRYWEIEIDKLLQQLVTIILPYLPFSSLLGFRPVPAMFLFALSIILTSYIILAEFGKKVFYSKFAKEK